MGPIPEHVGGGGDEKPQVPSPQAPTDPSGFRQGSFEWVLDEGTHRLDKVDPNLR